MDKQEIVQFALRWVLANFEQVEDFFHEGDEDPPFDRAVIEDMLKEGK